MVGVWVRVWDTLWLLRDVMYVGCAPAKMVCFGRSRPASRQPAIHVRGLSKSPSPFVAPRCSHGSTAGLLHTDDPRFRPWYVLAATPQPKDVVIVIDSSGSMSWYNRMAKAKVSACWCVLADATATVWNLAAGGGIIVGDTRSTNTCEALHDAVYHPSGSGTRGPGHSEPQRLRERGGL